MLGKHIPVFLGIASGVRGYVFYRQQAGPPENGTMDYRMFELDPESDLLPTNATGRIQFPGRDLSQPPPTNNIPEETEMWTLNLNFTYVPNPPEPGDEGIEIPWSFETNLGLQQPDSMVGTTDDERWMPCVTVYEFYPADDQRYTDQARESGPNGSCDPYLAQECRDALNDGLNQNLLTNGTCSHFEMPEVCNDMEIDGVSGWGEFENATMELTPRNYKQGVPFFKTATVPSIDFATDEEVLNDTYDTQSTGVFAVMIQWASKTSANGENGDNNEINEAGLTSILACISATDFAPGSRVPDDTPEDNGAALPSGGDGFLYKTFLAVLVTSLALVIR